MTAQYMTAELTPSKLDNAQFTCIAPNGSLAGSDLMGQLMMVNPQNGKVLYHYPETEDDQAYYNLGNGNAISNTGVVLACRNDADVCWWKDGEFHSLTPLKEGNVTNGANGITPDGLTICGYCGVTAMSTEDTLTPMSVPVIWKLKSDGTYGDPIQLPYPERDFSGRIPQYVLATCISDDGRTIAGQIQDYSGAMPQPIIWRLSDSNTWKYETLGDDLLNPDHIEFPEYPDIEPKRPNAENFMSPEGIADYNEAYSAWAASGYTGEMPNQTDYMTDEELAAYNAAMDEYNAAMEIYSPKFNAFMEVWYSFLDSGKGTFFVFNSTSLTPDGKQLMQMEQKEILTDDPNAWMPFVTKYGPAVFNLENGKYKAYGIGQNCEPSQIVADGSIIGSVTNEDLGTIRAAIYKPADWNSDVTPEFGWLDEYVKTKNTEIYNWMKLNMFADFEVEDWEGNVTNYKNVWFTGFPMATPDMNTIVSTQQNTFDMESEAMTFGFCMPFQETSGIRNVAGESCMTVKAQRGGLVELQSVKEVKIYDAEGRLVYDAKDINGSVNTGLQGICIVRATGTDGEVKTLKVNF